MSLILNIETSSKNCSVSISQNGSLLCNFDHEEDKFRHSELLTSTIKNLLDENNFTVKDLSAVAIGVGPGSFTGLRIGFSVAKGICFPNNTKLIGISSLKILANSVNKKDGNILSLINDKWETFYYSVYDKSLNEIEPPSIKIIDENFFQSINNFSTIVVNDELSFEYLKSIIPRENVQKNIITSINMIDLSYKKYKAKSFKEIAYFEPLYVKKPYV